MPQISTTDAADEAPAGPLERGLTVLRTLAAAPGGRLSASELARATGLARSPVDRIATTLVHLGHLRADGRDLALAPRSMELGGAYLRAAPWRTYSGRSPSSWPTPSTNPSRSRCRTWTRSASSRRPPADAPCP